MILNIKEWVHIKIYTFLCTIQKCQSYNTPILYAICTN
jgi:hypothetical protein